MSTLLDASKVFSQQCGSMDEFSRGHHKTHQAIHHHVMVKKSLIPYIGINFARVEEIKGAD